MVEKSLPFSALSHRHTGVSEGLASSYSEAARVCLDRHHVSPAVFLVSDNNSNESVRAEWAKADAGLVRAWANRDDATEFGAYAMSLAAIEVFRGLVAIRRAETRTGSDYYLGYPGGAAEDLEGAFRLEVSGTDDGNEATILGRLREKQAQAQRGLSNLPAIASIVGFAALRVVTVDVEDT